MHVPRILYRHKGTAAGAPRDGPPRDGIIASHRKERCAGVHETQWNIGETRTSETGYGVGASGIPASGEFDLGRRPGDLYFPRLYPRAICIHHDVARATTEGIGLASTSQLREGATGWECIRERMRSLATATGAPWRRVSAGMLWTNLALARYDRSAMACKEERQASNAEVILPRVSLRWPALASCLPMTK